MKPYLTAIQCSNLETSVKWYADLFNLELVEDLKYPEYGLKIQILEHGSGFRFEIIEKEGIVPLASLIEFPPLQPPTFGIVKLAFWIDDMEQFLNKIKAQNINILMNTTEQPSRGYKFIIFQDPDGVIVQVFSSI